MKIRTIRVAWKFNLGNYEMRELMVEAELDSSHEFNNKMLEELEGKLVEANLFLEQNKRALIKVTQDKVLAQLGVSSPQAEKKENP